MAARTVQSRAVRILALGWIAGAAPLLALDPEPAPGARRPAFALRVLGALGGDTDTDLSCFLLGAPGAGAAPLMIDGGSVIPGIVRWKERDGVLDPGATWTRRIQLVKEVLRPIRTLLVTHPHLDHVGGFVQKSTLDYTLATEGRPPLEIVGLPETSRAMGELLFKPPLWVDFTRIPQDNPAIRLRSLDESQELESGPYRIQVARLHHTVPCAAFLISAGAELYAHLGDTGPTQAVWNACRPALEKGRLRAIAVEVSYPAAMEGLALLTGHLTRSSLLLELNKLTRTVKDPPPASGMTEAQARLLSRQLAPELRGVTLLATHLKAAAYDQIAAELGVLRQEGLHLVLPEQGRLYEF